MDLVQEVTDTPMCIDKIVKLKVKDQEHLVRTEVHGASAAAFKAVGLRVPERVQTMEEIEFPENREM